MSLAAEVIVVGAGAAGLWAAARAARLGADVLLLEKTARTGTKVLASGGTRCNLTTTLPPDEAARLFGARAERFLRPAFRALPPAAVRERFAELGVPTVEAPWEKVFPASDRARDVREALERDARSAGVRIECNAAVEAVVPVAGRWSLRLGGGRVAECARLGLCPGGRSYPRTGTTGDGYGWLGELGLDVVEPVPALVPLTSPARWVQKLTGIAVQDAEARLVDARGKTRGRRRRPVLFTHTGLSGPAAMDLSEPVARTAGGGFELVVDLAPDESWEELRARLVDAAGRAGSPPVHGVLAPELPRRLFGAVLHQAGIAGRGPRANELARSARHGLIEALKGLRVPIDGTLGFDKAEVTAGGLSLRELSPSTMEVRGRPGLFVFGELLDVAGPIGGLNFQAAFATAELAAGALAASRER